MTAVGARTLSATLALAALASGQTFVVDAGNAPGTHFTSIAAAVAAVPDGAVLEVRSGTYGEFAIQSKNLTVIGEPGVIVLGVLQFPISVTGLLPQQAETLRRLSWVNTLGPGTLRCQNCAGTVLVDDCDASNGTSFGGRIVADACERVWVRDCALRPGASVHVLECDQSNVVVADSTLTATGPGTLVNGGRLFLSDCVLDSAWFFTPDVIRIAGGEVWINDGTELRGSPFQSTTAISGTGTVTLDGSTVLVNVATPPYGAGIQVIQRDIPALVASTQGLGGNAGATLEVPPAHLGGIAVGFPGLPFLVPGVAVPVWLAGPVLQAAGGAPTVTAGYPVPNAPWVVGIQVAWQGATMDPTGNLAASNPAAYAHH